jgi:hypothetical protein
MLPDLLILVAAMCDPATRDILGFPVHRCVAMKLPPARLNTAAFITLQRAMGYKYRVGQKRRRSREYDTTFYDAANEIVVTMQPVWYCMNVRNEPTMFEFSMQVVSYVQRAELVQKRRTLQFDLAGKTVRGVNYSYDTGDVIYEDVLPQVNKVDFCVVPAQ